MSCDHRGEIEIQNPVAVCDHKCVAAEIIAQTVERTAGAEQHGLGRVGDVQAKLRAVAESILHLAREVMDVNRDLGDAGALEHRERIGDQRASAKREHRLGCFEAERAEALAHSRGKYECSHGIKAAQSCGNCAGISASIRRACARACGM